jgi:RND superfamily putative drug exporter
VSDRIRSDATILIGAVKPDKYAAVVLERWTRLVIKRRVIVVVIWVVITLLGVASASRLTDLLTTSLTVPGTISARANTILTRDFHENVEGTFTVVVPFSDATTNAIAQLEAEVRSAASKVPTGVVSEERAVGGLLYANVDTSMNLGQAANATGTLRTALRDVGLSNALVTGPPALQHDITPVLKGDLERGALLAFVLALLVLIAVLGVCWAVVVPFVVAGATIAGTLGVVFLLAHHFLMVLYVPNVVELIGLALAIDYSLFIVHRFRTEVSQENANVEDAIVATMRTAGTAVLFSGVAVAIGLATLLVVPVPFVRSLGAAGLVVPVFALASALTLQPALLSLLGHRGVQPVVVRGLMARRDVSSGVWARVARGVIRRPLLVLLMTLTILGGATFSIFWMQLTPGSLTAIPQNIQAARALTLVSNRVGSGAITPLEVIVDTGRRNGAVTGTASRQRLALAKAILKNPEVAIVAIGHTTPFEDSTRRYEQILVISREYFGSAGSQNLVNVLRDTTIPSASFPADSKVFVGGASAQGVDFLNSVYDALPWIVLLAFVIAYLILARAFRSLVLPLMAILLDLVSVGVADGVLVAVFRFGFGAPIFGTYHVSQIEGWVPVFLFAMLFGLSMDYEVFIVSRIREAWRNGATNDDAIVKGLSETGGVVTSAALIMVAALGGLVVGHIAGLQELGIGLAFGVLVDATLVRGLLLPSIMTLIGPRCWWLPNPVARLLRVTTPTLVIRGSEP